MMSICFIVYWLVYQVKPIYTINWFVYQEMVVFYLEADWSEK